MSQTGLRRRWSASRAFTQSVNHKRFHNGTYITRCIRWDFNWGLISYTFKLFSQHFQWHILETNKQIFRQVYEKIKKLKDKLRRGWRANMEGRQVTSIIDSQTVVCPITYWFANNTNSSPPTHMKTQVREKAPTYPP